MRRLSVIVCVAAAFVPCASAWADPVLLTGDSMMYVIERELSLELEAAGASEVRLDSRVGSGITKPFVFGWVSYAAEQAMRFSPSVTIAFLGAGDTYALGRVRCCGPAWVEAYARRAERMIRAWQRGGSARVYWLGIPTPGDPRLAQIHRAVDRAVARAVWRVGAGAAVIDLAPFITPGERFRRTMVWQGRRVVVRARDGVHLTHTGAGIAAGHIRAVLQRDGVL
jgi:hypothetical protein